MFIERNKLPTLLRSLTVYNTPCFRYTYLNYYDDSNFRSWLITKLNIVMDSRVLRLDKKKPIDRKRVIVEGKLITFFPLGAAVS